MPILEEYWAGVLNRVNIEVRTFARLIRHSAQMGTENEAIFARLLERLLPRKYGIGTGMIIDSHDNYSRQTDIVIYSLAEQPTLFAQSTELIYPVEAVTATIEVKTRLSGADLPDIIRKTKQLRHLQAYGKTASASEPYNGDVPYCAALSYGTRVAPVAVLRQLLEGEAEGWPDLMCVIDSGLVICRNGELAGSVPGQLFAGVALAHKRDVDGARMPGLYELASVESEASLGIDNLEYAIEPARALLVFLQALASALARRKSPSVDVMGLYLREPVNELFPITV